MSRIAADSPKLRDRSVSGDDGGRPGAAARPGEEKTSKIYRENPWGGEAFTTVFASRVAADPRSQRGTPRSSARAPPRWRRARRRSPRARGAAAPRHILRAEARWTPGGARSKRWRAWRVASGFAKPSPRRRGANARRNARRRTPGSWICRARSTRCRIGCGARWRRGEQRCSSPPRTRERLDGVGDDGDRRRDHAKARARSGTPRTPRTGTPPPMPPPNSKAERQGRGTFLTCAAVRPGARARSPSRPAAAYAWRATMACASLRGEGPAPSPASRGV